MGKVTAESERLVVEIARTENGGDLPLPQYATVMSAGMDLHAAVQHDLVLRPLQRALVPTGVRIALPQGFEAQVRPRSGLAARHGVTLLNSPGTIDADYRGEIQVVVINLGEQEFAIHRGDRVAQLVVSPITPVRWRLVEDLPSTERGAGGFGHTG